MQQIIWYSREKFEKGELYIYNRGKENDEIFKHYFIGQDNYNQMYIDYIPFFGDKVPTERLVIDTNIINGEQFEVLKIDETVFDYIDINDKPPINKDSILAVYYNELVSLSTEIDITEQLEKQFDRLILREQLAYLNKKMQKIMNQIATLI